MVDVPPFFIGQHDLAVLHPGSELAAFYGGHLILAAARLDAVPDVLRADAAGDDVVGEDLGERGLVLGHHQGVDGAGGSLAKASLVGAKTVNGPGELRVSTRPAALTAATRVVWMGELTAFSTMVLVGYMAAPPTMGSLHIAHLGTNCGGCAERGDGQGRCDYGCEDCLLHDFFPFDVPRI